MNIVDLIVFVIIIVFVLVFYRLGFWAALKSFISFSFATIAGSYLLGPILDRLSNFGWRENVFTPLVVYPFIIILIWGVIMVVLNLLVPSRTGKFLSIISIVISIIYGFLVCAVLYLFVPQLIAPSSIALTDNSAFAKTINNISGIKNYRSRFLGPISSDMAKSALLSSEANEAMILQISPKKVSSSPSLANGLFNLINSSRQTASQKPLQRDPLLDQVALNYANEIIKTKRFSHLDSSGGDPQKRAKALGAQFDYLGENLAFASTVEAAHYGLIASTTHRANIQSPIFRKVGIAVLDIDKSDKLVVEEFSN